MFISRQVYIHGFDWEFLIESLERNKINFFEVLCDCTSKLASSPGHSHRSHGEKSGEGLVPILRHGPEMVDSVST